MDEFAQKKFCYLQKRNFDNLRNFDFQHLILKYLRGKNPKTTISEFLLQNCIFYSEINICFKYLDQNKLFNKFHEKANLFITLCMIMYYISCFFLIPFPTFVQNLLHVGGSSSTMYQRQPSWYRGMYENIKKKITPNTKLL